MTDRFGDIMMDNLRARECVLHTEYCTSLQTQVDRYSIRVVGGGGGEGTSLVTSRWITSEPECVLHIGYYISLQTQVDRYIFVCVCVGRG